MQRLALAVLVVLSTVSCSKAPPTGSATSSAVVAGDLAQQGAPAPTFSGKTHDGRTVSLESLRGKNVVLYFYPKDDTPGCTVEARGFKETSGDFEKAKAVVVGVSAVDAESHRAFAEKYSLPFVLLPDADHAIAGAFGVPVSAGFEKRVTFVIDPAGKIVKVWPSVTPDGHAEEVLAVVNGIGKGS